MVTLVGNRHSVSCRVLVAVRADSIVSAKMDIGDKKSSTGQFDEEPHSNRKTWQRYG